MGIVHGERTLKEVVEERERNQAATGYQIDGAFVEAVVDKRAPVTRQFTLGDKTPDLAAAKGQRSAYWKKEWLGFKLWDMDRLRAGNVVEGPAIIEQAMTTCHPAGEAGRVGCTPGVVVSLR